MKKLTFTTAIIMAMTASSVFAHHPAADAVDPEVYEMINENVADSPHDEMLVEDMGSSTMEQAAAIQNSGAIDMAEAAVGTDVAMDSTDMVDTIELMEDVGEILAQ
jgi:hypothetical protein